MLVTTTQNFEGYKVTEYLGLVRGLVVRSPNIVQGFLGGLKTVIGGRIHAYSQMCEQTRQEAYDLMLQHAQELGANAIIGIHYDASDVGKSNITEVLCYGTAVKIEKTRI